VRLFDKSEDLVLILDGSPLGFRPGLAALAHMNLMAFLRENCSFGRLRPQILQ
jgi:hypothetical protein